MQLGWFELIVSSLSQLSCRGRPKQGVSRWPLNLVLWCQWNRSRWRRAHQRKCWPKQSFRDFIASHRALLRQHDMKFQLLKAAERRQVDDFRANEVRLYLRFFWPFHAVFHRVNCKRFQGPLEIFTSAPLPMACFQPAPLEKLDIAKV